MQNDVRFGLFVAAGVVLACGSKRLSFTTPEATVATKEASEAAVVPDRGDPAESISAPPPSTSALVDLFPADLRDQANKKEAPLGIASTDSPTKSRPSKKSPIDKAAESSLASAGQSSGELVLPGMDWLDSKADDPKKSQRPKPLPEPSVEAKPKGPAHPYFQRYLDEGSYFVREGDVLADIAHNLYQDSDKVRAILEANPELLQSAADLRPGMRLKLPK